MARGFISIVLVSLLTAVSGASIGMCETAPSGTILSISVFGNQRLRDELVLMKLGIQPGDSLSDAEVAAGLARIETLSGVRSVQSRVLRNEGEAGVRLVIIVEEGATRSIRPLVHRTFANKIAFGAAVEESNLRGWNEQLRASVLFRGATIITGSWLKPYLSGSRLFSAGARVRYRFYNYPFPDFEALLLDDDISWTEASASLHIHPTEHLTFTLSPGIDRIALADSMLIGQGRSEVPPAPSGTFSTFEAGIEIDMLDRDFYPRNGFRINASRRDWGIFQGDAAMKNFLYRFNGLFCLALGRVLLSFDSRGTFVHGRVPITLVQHLGGEESIRGYEFGALSGHNCILGRTEIRIPLNFDDLDDLGNPVVLVDFNAFLDSGACWSGGESLDADRFHSGFGCGLNFIPVENRLLKVGYAWRRETSGTWYFDIGTMF